MGLPTMVSPVALFFQKIRVDKFFNHVWHLVLWVTVCSRSFLHLLSAPSPVFFFGVSARASRGSEKCLAPQPLEATDP